MKRKEIILFLKDIERKFPVDQWQVEGIHIWPLIRIRLAAEIDDSSVFPPAELTQEIGTNVLTQIKNFRYKINYSLRKSIDQKRSLIAYKANERKLLNEVRVIFFSLPHYRIYLAGKWFHKYIDPLIDHFNHKGLNSLFFELNDGTTFRHPIYYKDKHVNADYIFDLLRKKIKLSEGRDIKLSQYDLFLKSITEKIGRNIPTLSVPNIIEETTYIKRVADYFGTIIKANKTKLCITSCYYHPIGMALNLAAYNCDILSVDIQHGSQGFYHVAYGNWNKVPTEGFELLPKIFWSWNRNDMESINDWARKTQKAHKAIEGGNPLYSIWKNLEGKLHITNESNNTDAKKKISEVRILFSLQPMPDFLPEWFLEAVEKSPDNWKWNFRIHPNQMKDKSKISHKLINRFGKGKVEVEKATIVPLPALLQHIDVHVTEFSTVVLEAEIFGIPSILIHQNGRDLYAQQIKMHMAFFVNNKAELINEIKRLSKHKFRRKKIIPLEKSINYLLKN